MMGKIIIASLLFFAGCATTMPRPKESKLNQIRLIITNNFPIEVGVIVDCASEDKERLVVIKPNSSNVFYTNLNINEKWACVINGFLSRNKDK